MSVEQIYTGCLAEAAYFIESNGEAAIVDPLREIEPYLRMAKERNVKIKYIFETHFHADFVSGHLDLAKATGATIVYGPTAQPNFTAYVAADNEVLPLGNVKIKVLHTPGHTMESSSFLLIDEDGKMNCLFSGDTLFIGDVGRPDLAVKSDLSMEDLAGLLYESLHSKILPLPDDVIIYPGHGAGSACGKKMSSETTDTLGHQKKVNYALQPMSKAEFVKEVITGLVAPPQYFPKNAVMNKMGYESFNNVLGKGLTPLGAEDFNQKILEGALVLDTRKPEAFRDGHVPGALFIGVDGSFASWVGTLITDLKKPIVFIADKGREEEVVTRMSRVGYDNPQGFLDGGMQAWLAAGMPVEKENQISAEEFAQRFEVEELNALDVRKQSEFESEHFFGIENFPLDFIHQNISKLDKNKQYFVHCAGGYRSMIALSILKQYGFKNIVDIAGGFNELAKTSLPKSAYVCPSTML